MTPQPPHSPELEQAALGSLLIDGDLFKAVEIEPEYFYLAKHRLIFEAMSRLSSAGSDIDLLTVQAELESTNRLADVGGPSYLTLLVTSTADAYNLPSYVAKLRRLWLHRDTLDVSRALAKTGYDKSADVDTQRSDAAARLLQHAATVRQAKPLAALVSHAWDRAVEAKDGEGQTFVPTAFRDLNHVLGGGLRFGEMAILGGVPGIGKSAFALSAAMHMAGSAPGAFFSLEMSDLQVGMRAVAMEAGLNTQYMRQGELSAREWEKFVAAQDTLARLPMYISTGSHTTANIRAGLVRLQQQHGIRWCVIDYLKKINDENPSETARIETISRRLADLAVDLDIALLVIHSITKEAMARVSNSKDGVPHMSDLRDSGQLPYDARVVLFLYQPAKYEKDPQWQNIVILAVAKQNEGPTGAMELVKVPGLPLLKDAAIDAFQDEPQAARGNGQYRRDLA